MSARHVRLAARAVSVRARGAVLLDDVTLELVAGEVLALVGPNGAGKSTLLGALAGDLLPGTSRGTTCIGEVTLDGAPLRARSAAELARRRAVVRQRALVDAELHAAELVALGRPGATWAEAAHHLEQVGLRGMAERRYPTLSGGERARVQLARALLQLGEGADTVLLLDEPTAALDPQEQHRALALARAQAARGVTVLVIVHDLTLAARYADRVAVLASGRLLTCEAPTRALAPEILRAAFALDFELVPTSSGPVPLARRPPLAARPLG